MENNQSTETMVANSIDIKRLLNVLKRGFWLLLLAFIVGGGVAFAISSLQTPIYKATTQVIVARPSSSQAVVTDMTQTLTSQQVAETYVELLSQPWVVMDVSQRVGGNVSAAQFKIAAVANTQIIDIIAEDPSPERAALIADTLVKILIEQNDTIQSGRYIDAEKNLNTQIDQVTQQISTTQVNLKQANLDALTAQVDITKNNIQNTQAAIASLQAEILNLTSLVNTSSVTSRLGYDQSRLSTLQTTLNQQLANYDALNLKMTSDPQVQQDPALAAAIQSQMSELGVSINGSREQIDLVSREIDWLTPFLDAKVLSTTLTDRNNELTTQQSLLKSYQQTYVDLLTTGKIRGTTDEIVNLDKNLTLYQGIYVNLLNNRETVRLNRMQNILAVVQTKPALTFKNPVRPTIPTNTILGAAGSLALAVVVLLLMDFLDTTIKSNDEVERVLGLPIMGYSLVLEPLAADKQGPYVAHIPRSPAAEAFRSLRTNLEFIGVDKPLRSLLISSPGASEGKTTISSNLAAVIAQSGKKVVLLDADFRRPRVHRAMGLSNRVGLSDVFRDKLSLKDVLQPWDGLSLSVITSGGIPPNPAELLASEKMRLILDELQSEFDLVIIDSAPTIVTDSQLIAARVDGVLLVLNSGKTHMDAARSSVVQYRRVGAHLLGVVMNNIQPGSGYGYVNYQYYRYEHDEAAPDSKGGNSRITLPWKRGKPSKKSRTESETGG